MAGQMFKNKGKIRFHLLIIGLLVFTMLGTTAILTSVALKSQTNTLTESTLQSNFEGARNLNVAMNMLLDSMQRSLGSAGKYIADNDLTLEQSSNFLSTMLSGQRSFNSVVIFDESGVIRSSTPESAGLREGKINTPAASKALKDRKPFVSEPYMDSKGQLTVMISHPLFDRTKQYRGFIAGFIYLQELNVFSDIFNHAIRSQKGSYAYVVDRSGKLMFNPDKGRIGEVPDAEELQAQFMKDKGRTATIDVNSQAYLAGYVAIPNIGWGVVFQSPATAVDEAMRSLIISQLKVVIPLFGVLVAVSLWVAQKVTHPFKLLTATARSIFVGERITDPPFTNHWNYEAHHLARAMMRAFGGLQDQADQMSEEARTDKLTGLANRLALDERLSKWMSEGLNWSLLILDIDHFKSVNDTFGHKTGDETLLHLARILESQTRDEDLVCRFGGEEFVIVMPSQSLLAGRQLAERIRKKVESTVSPTGKPITVSIGLASYPEHGDNFNQVFEMADLAMYNAKRDGRNLTKSADDYQHEVV
ncbi:sensor domain-containing diguanylate cyclase [Paenibacillus andongensis]|uniref:sensor domain-containing diguanylate cyclase n=1 Tax=Paenibacillus andongensis TaxID=2975482 RepID=UPI0021BAF980|nr:sensor domain-containing diguanylate cyclase [Paenibacillus andongensis]